MLRSLLDRLIDLAPDNRSEPVQQRASYDQVRTGVERDLENLLNTKCFVGELSETLPQLGRSLFTYGLSDYTAKNPSSPSVRGELRQEIERMVHQFEPRLINVSVRVEAPTGTERRVRFTIAALLRVDDEAQPVSFDAYYDSMRCEYRIKN